MHIRTHVLSGWCAADLLDLAPRERALAMMAATAADLDGLGLLVSLEAYGEYHHVRAHILAFGVLLSALLTAFSPHRLKAFGLHLVLFHIHLVLDHLFSATTARTGPDRRERIAPHHRKRRSSERNWMASRTWAGRMGCDPSRSARVRATLRMRSWARAERWRSVMAASR